MNQKSKTTHSMWEAILWALMILLALFVFLASYLPILNEMHDTIGRNEWVESRRPFGFLIDRVFNRLIEYPEFFALGALGFLSITLLHFGFKKIGIKQTPRILIWLSTLSALIILIGAFTLMAGPIIVKVNP